MKPAQTVRPSSRSASGRGAEDPIGAASPDDGIVVVRDLVKRYEDADRNAVDGVSFTVTRGELFALLGPNGAGKTTTISILTTTLAPTSGELWIAGHDVDDEPDEVRRSCGIIFQQPSLDLNLTAEENVRLHAVLYGLYPFRPIFRMMPVEYRSQLRELSAVLGLEDQIFDPVRTFSGGMKRKLEIIRSLIHRPPVLFLDEPTTGLDPRSRRDLWTYLADVRDDDGTTLFLTTHYLDEAEQADTICILSQGRVVSLGAPDDVKADLVERYLLIDSPERERLRSELDSRSVAYREVRGQVGRFRVDIRQRDIHALLKAIDTPLSVVQTHAPSLEDAYLAIVERTMEEELGVDLPDDPTQAGSEHDAATVGGPIGGGGR